MRPVSADNTGNGLAGKHAVGVRKIKQRADVGIVLIVVGAVTTREIAVQLGQHIASIKLSLREALGDNQFHRLVNTAGIWEAIRGAVRTVRVVGTILEGGVAEGAFGSAIVDATGR